MFRTVVVCLLAAGVAGCVDTSSATFQQKIADRCAGFGYAAGSQAMADCRMQMTMMQEQDNMRRKQNMANAVSDSVDDMNRNMAIQRQQSFEAIQRQQDRNAYSQAHQQPLYQPNRTINCVSTPNFGQVRTTCQ